MLPLSINALIEEYTPLLVLYPEIKPGLSRKEDRNADYPHVSPLNHDYHPRDIRLVLNHAAIHGRSLFHPLGRKGPGHWRRMLDRMARFSYERDLNIVRSLSPTDRDGFWDAYAQIPKDRPEHQRRCYARLVPGRGLDADRVLLQYWYAYFYNDFWNTHEMDWEMVAVVFTNERQPRPTVCAYSAHHGGHWLRWADVQKADAQGNRRTSGTHPVVYVAHGSHANYFFGGTLYPTVPPAARLVARLVDPRTPIDYVASFEEGARHLVPAKVIPEPVAGRWAKEPEEDWRWLNQRGRWGSPGRALDLEFGDDGPYGPPVQKERWETPFQWINARCKEAHDPRLPTRLEPSH